MRRSTPHSQYGLTLLELTVVLLILISLGGLMLPFVGGTGQYARCTSTETSMRAIRDALVGSFEQPGFAEDMKGLTGNNLGVPNNLDELVNQGAQPNFNPATKKGWRGPYLNTNLRDAYSLNDIALQIPNAGEGDGNDCSDLGYTEPNICARLVSPGPTDTGDDGLPDTTLADANGTNRGDDRILYLFIPDPQSNMSQPCQDQL